MKQLTVYVDSIKEVKTSGEWDTAADLADVNKHVTLCKETIEAVKTTCRRMRPLLPAQPSGPDEKPQARARRPSAKELLIRQARPTRAGMPHLVS